MLIATAGHVDHGKTTLVQALTGIDTDRLAEEKARGLSIDLGFAYQTIGTETPTRLGFVDVPGHERFVRNMLAGVAAVDCALLVIAADDGPMPQTREHLAIMSLLGVTRAIVALTKIDRVAPQRLAAVAEEITALLAPTAMRDARVFPVAAISGTGIPALANAIHSMAKTLPPRTIPSATNFRLAVDRRFSVRGIGLVVTGAVFAGAIEVNAQLLLLPSGKRVRVRGIHSQGLAADAAQVGQRCALDLVGLGSRIGVEDVQRGDWLVAANQSLLSARMDLKVHLLDSEDHALKGSSLVRVHIGAAATRGRLTLLGDKRLVPGGQSYAQLVFDQPLHAVFADRIVLRDQVGSRTIGGGSIIDPLAQGRGRNQPSRLAFLEAINCPDHAQALTASLARSPNGVDLNAFANARNVTFGYVNELAALHGAINLAGTGQARHAIAPLRWENLLASLLAGIGAYHHTHSDSVGPTTEALLKMGCSSEPRLLQQSAVQALIREGRLVRAGTRIRLTDHIPTLSVEDQRALDAIYQYIGPDQRKPPALKDLCRLLDAQAAEVEISLKGAARRGLLVPVSATRYFHPDAIADFVAACTHLSEQSSDQQFSVRELCNAAEIGRNVAVDLLEYLDSIGVTVRAGDRRRMAH